MDIVLEILNVNPDMFNTKSIGNNQASKARLVVIPIPRKMVSFLDGMNQRIIADNAGKKIQIMDDVIAAHLVDP
jgi:hypothetical protein